MRGDLMFLVSLMSIASAAILYIGSDNSYKYIYGTSESLKEKLRDRMHEVAPKCCEELTKECFACATGLLVEEFCKRHSGEYGCPKQPTPIACKMQTVTGVRVKTRTKPPFIIYTHEFKTDIHVSGSIQRRGIWEPHFIKQFATYLDKYPTAYVVDIGANIGMYSLFAAKKGHVVYAFEPVRKNIIRQCNSIVDNNFTNLNLFPYALSHKELTVNFIEPSDNVGGTHTVEIEETSGVENVDYAKAYTLDSFEIPSDKPIIMKIDIEGSECEMMNGAHEFFHVHDIKIILMEWGQIAKKCKTIDTIIKTLQSKGLSIYDAGGNHRLNMTEKPWTKHWDVVWK